MSITTTPAEITQEPVIEFPILIQNRTERAKRRSDLREERLRQLQDPTANKILVGHWTYDQTSRYFVFLTVYQQNFSQRSLRRTQKIFKEMCKFIRTRTADQCRSHHQKMEKKCDTFLNILQYLGNFFPINENQRESLTEQCVGLKKLIFKQNKQRRDQIKVQEQKNFMNVFNQNQMLKPQMLGCRPSSDMSIYLQNGYYVMPIFPCSAYYFYTNYFQSSQRWNMNGSCDPCNKF